MKNRYYVYDRAVHPGQKFTYSTGPRWWVIDRETGRAVDEGETRYEATQAARNLNSAVA